MKSEASTSKISWSSESSIKALLRKFLEIFKPPERISKSEWAEQHRRLSREASSRGGSRFTFDEAPWQREVLDAPDDPNTGRVVCMWASQVTGKTETINNIVGHQIDIDPCPMLILQPTLEMAETWSKDRLATMLRDNSRLRGKVKDPRSRDADNKILHKRFPGGHISIAGANSAASLSSRPIRIVIFDEVDRYPSSAGTEGDPMALAEKRTESFPDAFVFEVSTPTVKNFSRIEKDFEDSDKRYWFCPCPHCKVEKTLKWGQVKWLTDGDKVAYWYECEACQKPWDDEQRQASIRAGKWKATAPFKGVRGYHLNGIYCLFRPKKPFKNRIEQMVEEFLKAKANGPEQLKVWTNTFLAETWAEEGERIDTEPLLQRREPYGPKLPNSVLVLTCAVDVQGDRLEAEILGHGRNEETWGIEYRVLFGNPQQQAIWTDLDHVLSGAWEREDGAKLKLSITCIDTGDGKTQKMAYQFIKPRQARKVFACKGSSIANASLVRRSQPNKKNPAPQRVHLFIIGTDTAKATIHARLQLTDHGPRFQHFPQGFGYDEEYFKQLTAEEMRLHYTKGFPVRTWWKTRPRNEALDNRVLGLAAFEILNPRLDQIEKDLLAAAKLASTGQVAAEPQTRDYVLNPTETPDKPVVRDMRRSVNRATGQQRGGWVKGWK